MHACVLALLLAFVPQEDLDTRPAARVTTLELEQELVSFGRLGGVAVDDEGTIFVSNFGPNVWSIGPGGKVREIATDLGQASGNTVAPDGSLLQADFLRKAIYSIDPESMEVFPVVTGGLAGPVGLVADAEWNLYVCDCTLNSVQKVLPDGTVRRFAAGALFACPNGITLDEAGNLFVVNFGNDLLVEIDRRGQATVVATVGSGNGNAHVALVGDEVYVTKAKTNQLYAVGVRGARRGEVRLAAGDGRPEIVDGTGTRASLRHPNGLAVDASGRRLYTNNIVGKWRGTEPTTLVIRRIELH